MNKRISDIFSYEDEPIFWESCEEIDPETVKTLTLRRIRPRRARRVSRTLLIAAVIVSLLTVSAIAVGLSVQTQRKENLRQMLEIDAKNVDGYTEFPIPSESDSGEAAPSVVLLSAVKDGECETVYVSISPIEEKDMFSGDRFEWTLDGKYYGSVQPAYDRSKLTYTPVTNKYNGQVANLPDPEQERQAILESYDAQTKSGLFEFILFRDGSDYDINKPLDIDIYKYYRNRDTLEVTEREKYGTIHLEPIEDSCISLRFAEPPTFENPDTGGKGWILGADIYATSISWIIQHDDMEEIYHRSDGTPSKLSFDEYRALSLSWIHTLDEATCINSSIEYTDGEKVALIYSANHSYYDGNQVINYVQTPETLDLSRISSLTVLGETVYVEK